MSLQPCGFEALVPPRICTAKACHPGQHVTAGLPCRPPRFCTQHFCKLEVRSLLPELHPGGCVLCRGADSMFCQVQM